VSSEADPTGKVVRHERALAVVCLVALAGLCWWYLAARAGMSMDAMPEPPLGALVVMWWLMMVAMMLPSAVPAILLYARVRVMRGGDSAIAQTWVFLAGYLAVWLLFSVVAAAAQYALTGASMAIESRVAEGVVLIAAGLYQLSPLKSACLGQCRSPAQFVSRHWRPGTGGALRLGALHGAYCVGCCWMLMALLFVGGVMNLLWVAALATIVAAEKLLPRGEWLARAAGVALVGWGLVRLVA